jgi:hypothetical protein
MVDTTTLAGARKLTKAADPRIYSYSRNLAGSCWHQFFMCFCALCCVSTSTTLYSITIIKIDNNIIFYFSLDLKVCIII